MPIPWSQYNLIFHIFRIISRLSKPKLTFSNFPHCQHIHTYFPTVITMKIMSMLLLPCIRK